MDGLSRSFLRVPKRPHTAAATTATATATATATVTATVTVTVTVTATHTNRSWFRANNARIAVLTSIEPSLAVHTHLGLEPALRVVYPGVNNLLLGKT